MRRCPRIALLVACATFCSTALAGERMLDARFHHLRVGGEPEWSDFPRRAEGPSLKLEFTAEINRAEATLRLRHQNVKQVWTVRLNGAVIGRLRQDENDMVVYLAVPPRTLAPNNILTIEQANQAADDIRVGEIALDDRSVNAVLSDATVDLTVVERRRAGGKEPTPCRITILDDRGALRTVGASSDGKQAVRPGIIYSGDGRSRFGLPAGDYTIYAGRGMEYSIASVRVRLKPGDSIEKRLEIIREVPTEGWISCDTHIHTLTHSGHGDASLDERMLTIAGEGIELPIATEHNRQVDYAAAARKMGVARYFTAVAGNEVTTAVGHFNVFPAQVGGAVPEFQTTDGNKILDGIFRSGAKVVILNHPRDLHSGFRPFGPERHNAASGENEATWLLRANAVEVVNSGAQQTDVLRLYEDWFALLNRGATLAPIGGSDSHDVGRYIVGQARTYIRCPDERPEAIAVDEAVDSLLAGRVVVSCGLFADLTVNETYGPGDLAPPSEEVRAHVRVLGPSWTEVDHVALYANGIKIREAAVADGKRGGIKWDGTWILPRMRHDVHLAAIATGPAVSGLYWPIAKPYQPTSPNLRRRVIGSTGIVWIDADGDKKRTSALEYAKRLRKASPDDAAQFTLSLSEYDESVAIQAAGLLAAEEKIGSDGALSEASKKAGPHVEQGFRAFDEARRQTRIARARSREGLPGRDETRVP